MEISQDLSRQALIVTAYKDPCVLKRLVRYWCKAGGYVYLHIDKKSKDVITLIQKEVCWDRCCVVSTYSIRWGDLNHVLSVLDGMKWIIGLPNVDYVHIVSGQDLPVHPPNWFKRRFDECAVSYFSDKNSRVVGTDFEDWYDRFLVSKQLEHAKHFYVAS